MGKPDRPAGPSITSFGRNLERYDTPGASVRLRPSGGVLLWDEAAMDARPTVMGTKSVPNITTHPQK